MTTSIQYYQQVNPQFYRDQILTQVANQIDQAARQVYEDLRYCLWQSPEHLNRLILLCNQPRNCGATARANHLFLGASPFEQMIALENWLYCYNSQHGPLRQRYTFCLANSTTRLHGRAVPLSVETNATSMWRVKLGNQGIEYRAPTYANDWGYQDPWQNIGSENFIYHLEALEMVRQPNFIGATLIKGNAFESEYIDQDWRYGVTDLNGHDRREACVEFIHQNYLSQARSTIKQQSSAFNLFQLINQGYGEIDLCDHTRNFQDFFDAPQQIHQHFSMEVTPNDILDAINRPFMTTGRSNLYYKMFKLMVAKIGRQSTPNLRRFIIQRFNEAPFMLSYIKA